MKKRLLSLLVVLAMLVSLIPGIGTHDVLAATLASDNFDDGDSTGWTVVGGTWSIVTEGTGYAYQCTSTGVASSTFGDSAWTDYSAEMSIKADSFSTGNLGMMVRYNGSQYHYKVYYDTYWNTVYIFKQNGSGSILTSGKPSSSARPTAGQYFTLKAEVNGSTITAYINGEQVCTTTDTTFSSGNIAVYLYNQTGYYDNIAVNDFATPTPTPTPTPTSTPTPEPTATPTPTPEPTATPTPTPSATATPGILFSDDFEDGNSTGWTSTAGTWSVVSDTSFAFKGTHTSNAYAYTGNSLWSDYYAQMKIKADTFGTGNIGMCIRWLDAWNFYRVLYETGTNTIRIYKIVNGSATQLGYATPSNSPTAGQYFTLKAAVSGSTIDVYIDDVLVKSVTDTTFSIGKVATYLYNQTVYCDDVVVYGVVATPSPTPTPMPTPSPTPTPDPAATPTPTPVPQAEFYVAPNGSDTNPGTLAQPFATLEKARQAVAAINSSMTSNIVVYLKGGTYSQSATVNFTATDSGTNGHRVIYRNYPGEEPVLSGGQQVTGWSQVSGTSLYKASVAIDKFRQFYVDGVKKQRARKEMAVVGTGIYNDPNTTQAADGLYVDGSVIGYYSNASDIELAQPVEWKLTYYPVTSIVDGGSGKKIINLLNPFFNDSVNVINPTYVRFKYNKPIFIENAYELLDEPGEWYYNRTTQELFYYPEAGQDMATVYAVVPKLEKLMDIEGTLASKAKNITFEGIKFAYSTWTYPTGNGFNQTQSVDLRNLTFDIPAAIQVDAADNILFKGNKFMHMGACAINMNNGVINTNIVGNFFHDIAAGGVTVGADNHNTIDAGEEVCKNNVIMNNVFNKIATDYWGCVAVHGYWVDDLEISNNDMSDMPYSAISVGWGWNFYSGSTTCRNNKIYDNKIYNISKKIGDGAAIYTIAQQPSSYIVGNYIKDVKNYKTYAIYNDDSTSGYTISENVIENMDVWYFANIRANKITLDSNYTTTDKYKIHSDTSEITMTNTHYYPNANWPTAAQAIISVAGLQSAYQGLLNLIPTQTQPTYTTVFSDNFEDGNADGWTPSAGTWSVVTDGSYVYQGNSTGTVYSSAGQSTWTDYIAEAKIKRDTVTNSGVAVRYTDNSNNYMFIWEGFTWMTIYKVQNGSFTAIGTSSNVEPLVLNNGYHAFTVKVKGNIINAYIDGALVSAAVDNTFTSGKVATYLHNGTVRFDDVKVMTE